MSKTEPINTKQVNPVNEDLQIGGKTKSINER
jgi:hypothetical protein